MQAPLVACSVGYPGGYVAQNAFLLQQRVRGQLLTAVVFVGRTLEKKLH